jgi:hypothetical protein
MWLFMSRKRLYQQGWEKVTYRELVGGPLGKLVSTCLALADAEHATRITFGLPPGRELSAQDKAEILAQHKELMQVATPAIEKVRESDLGTRDGLVRFHRRDELPEVPLWRELDGQWHRSIGVPVFFSLASRNTCASGSCRSTASRLREATKNGSNTPAPRTLTTIAGLSGSILCLRPIMR